jgi:hypothetical protein
VTSDEQVPGVAFQVSGFRCQGLNEDSGFSIQEAEVRSQKPVPATTQQDFKGKGKRIKA